MEGEKKYRFVGNRKALNLTYLTSTTLISRPTLTNVMYRGGLLKYDCALKVCEAISPNMKVENLFQNIKNGEKNEKVENQED